MPPASNHSSVHSRPAMTVLPETSQETAGAAALEVLAVAPTRDREKATRRSAGEVEDRGGAGERRAEAPEQDRDQDDDREPGRPLAHPGGVSTIVDAGDWLRRFRQSQAGSAEPELRECGGGRGSVGRWPRYRRAREGPRVLYRSA